MEFKKKMVNQTMYTLIVLSKVIRLYVGCITIKTDTRAIVNFTKIGVTGNAYVMRRVTNQTSDKDTTPKT